MAFLAVSGIGKLDFFLRLNCLSALAAGSEMGGEQVELVCEEVAVALTSAPLEIAEALLKSRRRRKAVRLVGFIGEAAEQINRISFVIV